LLFFSFSGKGQGEREDDTMYYERPPASGAFLPGELGAATFSAGNVEREEQLHALVDAIPQLVWIARPDGFAEYHNRRWCDYTGLSNEQSRGEGWLQAVHPDDRQQLIANRLEAVQTGNLTEVEYRLRNGTTGEYHWFLIQAVPQKDSKGTLIKWLGACTDIDRQKCVEQQLKASEENLRILAETIPQFVWITRPDGYVEYWNQQFANYFQATPEQIQGHRWRQFLHPADYDRAVSIRHHTLATGEPYETTYRLRNGRTGVYHWFLARAVPLRDEVGQISKWFGTCTNIDEQKHIEEALRQSQERAQALMDSNIIGIFIAHSGQVVEANDTYLRMTGYTREDLCAGKINWIHMTPPEYAAQTEQTFCELAAQGYRTPYEKELICKDGSRLAVVVGGTILHNNPHQFIGFVLDNSARKELEQRKDDFLSMAGHELRTPLTSLKLQTQIVKKRLAKQGLHEMVAALARMEEPVRQLERLIGELLDVSKIQMGQLEYANEPVDLDALLREIADTMQQMSNSHTIVVHGAAPRCMIGDKGRLEQIFINLLSNAIKYAPDTPLIEVEASTSGESATIKVRDYGVGIPREQREKIFERFYRASDPSRRAVSGLGMGLYIVAQIVTRMGGTITVESEIGEGSTFVVTLPLERPTDRSWQPATM